MASLVTGHPPLKQDQRCVVAVMGEKSGGTRFTPLSDTEQHARSLCHDRSRQLSQAPGPETAGGFVLSGVFIGYSIALPRL